MPKVIPFFLLAAIVPISGCTTTTAPATSPLASAALRAADGTSAGSATLMWAGGKLELLIAATNLPAGPHGVHLHAAGACTPPDFASAGPHLNPQAKQHGADNPQGSHLGDLPNLTAGVDGRGELRIMLPGSQAQLEPQIFDGDGTAVVIHAAGDDYRTDPSGNTGGRIVCGVLIGR